MSRRRYAVFDVADQRQIVDLDDVPAWIRGFLTAATIAGDARAARIDQGITNKIRGERPDQTCYRILLACDDLDVLSYVGITTVETQ